MDVEPPKDNPVMDRQSTAEGMVERVTNAIERTRWSLAIRQCNGERLTSAECSRLAAVSAMEAMVEPTGTMWVAGYHVLCESEQPPNPEEHWEGWMAQQMWRAMVRAALGPPTAEGLRWGDPPPSAALSLDAAGQGLEEEASPQPGSASMCEPCAGEPSRGCTCQSYPTHCANDCPQHGELGYSEVTP